MSIRYFALAAFGMFAATLAVAPQANAGPDMGMTEEKASRPLARTDLEKMTPNALRQRRPAPQPSTALKQRELFGRALTIEFQTWAMISNSYDPDIYARYVASFPRGLFAPLARARAMYLIERREFERSQLGVR